MDWLVTVLDLFFWFLWLFVLMFAHEFGHWWKAKELGYRVEFSFFKTMVFHNGLTLEHDFLITLSGVVYGFFVLIFIWGIFSEWFFLFSVVFYFVGIRSDVYKLIRLWNVAGVRR